MRKVHEKSVVLGIGIGMIITAILGMIFSAGNPKELSKTEIISLAKGYGLVEDKLIYGDNASAESTNTAAKSTIEDSTPIKSASENVTERNIVIDIKYGSKSQDISGILLEKGVITSKEKFTAKLDLYEASTKIKTGTFMFKKNEDLDYIVKTICKLK